MWSKQAQKQIKERCFEPVRAPIAHRSGTGATTPLASYKTDQSMANII